MTIVGKGLEQETIDSITLLLSSIQSQSGLTELKKAIIHHEQVLLEDELEIAQKKVNELQKQLSQVGLVPGSSVEEEEEKEADSEPKKENSPQDNRPVFSIPRFERLIIGYFCSSRWKGKEFTVSDVKNYISDHLNLSISDYTYTTDNGSNLFTACVRNSTRGLVRRGVLKRVRNGVFAPESKQNTNELKKSGFINWIPEEA